MKLEMITGQEVLLRIKRDELLILNNALNEVCNGLDQEEFVTRMGATRREVEELLLQLASAMESMQ